ncbi:MAG: hypothetical protein LBF67_07555 [Prevotellaceae bacterium]|nr:hypothetical protein [Prevotellaceae bacterium]
MRKIVFIAAMLLTAALLSNKTIAQTAAYDRPTVNFLLITHGDAYDAPTSAFFGKMPKEDKFYYNELGVKDIKMSQMPRSSVSPTNWQPMLAELTRQNVAKKEVAAWYLRKPDGSMSMDLIHRRGEFNATDETFLMANATKRGMDELKDLGRKLISKTYVVALNYANITYAADASADIHTWKSTAQAMVFKLKFDTEMENSIYDAWPDEQDTPEAMAEKSKQFDQIPFALEFVQQVSVSATASALITGKPRGEQSSVQSLAKIGMSVTSKDALWNEMLKKGYNNVVGELEKKIADFQVKSGVLELDPIRAKIGKKEGLKTDQRYYVLEYEQNSKGKLKAVRKAVVRVGSGVADNRAMATGKSEASKFYQIAGRKVEKGMTLEQRNDAGIGVLMGGGLPITSKEEEVQLQMRIEVLTNKVLNLGVFPSLYVYAEGIMENTRYSLKSNFINDYELTADNGKANYTFMRWGFGLGRGLYFWRNFSISPYVGMGWEYVSVKDDISLETIYYKAGANFAVNIYYPFQLVGGVSGLFYGAPKFDSNSNSNSNSDDSSSSASTSLSSYGDVFGDRSSGSASGFVGIRFNF